MDWGWYRCFSPQGTQFELPIELRIRNAQRCTKCFSEKHRIQPICSMYGIFTYIWVIFGQMLVNIPYMEHMGLNIHHVLQVIEVSKTFRPCHCAQSYMVCMAVSCAHCRAMDATVRRPFFRSTERRCSSFRWEM